MSTDAETRLVESAQDLLWDRGYVGTSPKAIQGRAGVGQGSMYHHFAGKADLARAAIDRSAAQLRQRTDRHLSGAGSPLERLRRYLTAERDVLRGCQIGRLAYDPEVVARPALREPLDEAFGWLQTRLAQVVGQAQEAGELDRSLDPGPTAAAIAAVVQGGYVLARAAGSAEPFEQAAAGVGALLDAAAGVRP